MTHGSKRLSCRGIIGDGCGGDREFVIENGTLFAIDPVTNEEIILLDSIENAKTISKKGCKLFIQTQSKKIVFNLSTLSIE